ncbi:MAG: aldo/keto reductase [Actinomycetota bacterium]
MEYVRLGYSGLEVSTLGLGTWATIGEGVQDSTAATILDAAYDAGINFFDTAETYGDGVGEEAFGRLLAKSGWSRETFVVSTKLYWGTHGKRPNTWGLGRKHLLSGSHASLRRLGLDHLDLLVCHRFDDKVPLEETVGAIAHLIARGDVLHWGTSGWSVDQIQAANKIAAEVSAPSPIAEQVQYNLLYRDTVEQELSPLHDNGVGLVGWSPLAYGFLSGRYSRDLSESGRLSRPGFDWLHEWIAKDDIGEAVAIVAGLRTAADELGFTVAQVALAWAASGPNISSTLLGCSTTDQLAQNLAALELVSSSRPWRRIVDEAVQHELRTRSGVHDE